MQILDMHIVAGHFLDSNACLEAAVVCDVNANMAPLSLDRCILVSFQLGYLDALLLSL